jgi:hypothetical protein
MRPWAALAWLLALATGLPGAAQWHTVAMADAQGGWAQTTDDKGTPLYLGDLILSPALAWPDGDSLSPLLYVNSTAQQYSLENQQLFQRTWAYGARPTFMAPLDGVWKWGARALAQDSKNWETAGEISRMQGIYDYEEYGGGALLQRDSAAASTHVSLDLSWRDYPYDRSGVAAALSGTAGAVLDAWWWKLGLKQRDRLNDSTLLSVNGWVALRAYTDAYVVDAHDYVRVDDADRQKDVPGSLDVALDRRLGKAWAVELDAGCDALWSNQNLYDQHGAYTNISPPAGGIWIPGVDNTFDVRLDPGLLWQEQPWQAHLNAELLLRNTSRPIRHGDGVYTHGLESDVEYGLGLGGSRDLQWGHLSLVGNAAWRVVTSNQEFDQGQPAAYSYFNVSLGLQYSYASP